MQQSQQRKIGAQQYRGRVPTPSSALIHASFRDHTTAVTTTHSPQHIHNSSSSSSNSTLLPPVVGGLWADRMMTIVPSASESDPSTTGGGGGGGRGGDNTIARRLSPPCSSSSSALQMVPYPANQSSSADPRPPQQMVAELPLGVQEVLGPVAGRAVWSLSYLGDPNTATTATGATAGALALVPTGGGSRALSASGTAGGGGQSSVPAAAAPVLGLPPTLLYQLVERRLHNELQLLRPGNGTPEERFHIFREAGQQLATQLHPQTALFTSIMEEMDRYVASLKGNADRAIEAEAARDAALRREQEASIRAESKIFAAKEEYQSKLRNIEETLRTHQSVEQLVEQIRHQERLLTKEREEQAILRQSLAEVAHLRDEFERSVLLIEDSFVTVAREREVELASYRRDRLQAHAASIAAQDEKRQYMADIQLRLDAQQIVLETQIQREQLLSERLRDLEAFVTTQVQQIESLRKSLWESEAVATDLKAQVGVLEGEVERLRSGGGGRTPLNRSVVGRSGGNNTAAAVGEGESTTTAAAAGGAVAAVEHRRSVSHHATSPTHAGGSSSVTSPTTATAKLPVIPAGSVDGAFVQLRTPRPNKAEMVARVPDLGDPSKYPTTQSIIQALLQQHDMTTKKLADATFTLNKLEERIEVVVLARTELLLRQRRESAASTLLPTS